MPDLVRTALEACITVAEKATPGPWEIDDRPESDWVFIEPLVCQLERSQAHNAALIAASRTLAPAMARALLAFLEATAAYPELRVLCAPELAALAEIGGAV